MPDLVQWTLDTLDSSWSTANYDPKPTLIDQRDTDRVNKNGRSMVADLAENNAVGVGSQPDTEYTPSGTYDNARVDAAVSIRIEAVHEDEWGNVADAADFRALVGEVKRILWADRSYPVGDYYVLEIATESDLSTQHKDYYRVDLTVEFRGYESLP